MKISQEKLIDWSKVSATLLIQNQQTKAVAVPDAKFGGLSENCHSQAQVFEQLVPSCLGECYATLRIWSLDGGSTLLEADFESSGLAPLLVHAVYFILGAKNVTSQLPASACSHDTPSHYGLSHWNCKPN